jgi:hypothetical protein
VSADHIRYGLHPMPIGGEATLTKWGWACLGCHATLAREGFTPYEADKQQPAVDAFREKHEGHASWVGHPGYCNLRAGGACSCGRA